MTTPTQDIRRRLLAGETLTTRQCAADYGVSTALFGTVVKALRADGVTVDKVKIEGAHGAHAFTVSGATVDESAHGKARGVQRSTTGRRTAATVNGDDSAPLPARRAPKRNGLPVPALPELGSDLSVCLLAVDPDGRVSIGLRSGDQTWLTTVDGFSAR